MRQRCVRSAGAQGDAGGVARASAGGLGWGSGGALHLGLLSHDELVEALRALPLGVLHLLLEEDRAHRRRRRAQALAKGRGEHRDKGRQRSMGSRDG